MCINGLSTIESSPFPVGFSSPIAMPEHVSGWNMCIYAIETHIFSKMCPLERFDQAFTEKSRKNGKIALPNRRLQAVLWLAELP